MWFRRAELRRLLRQVEVAEARALAAESALADERRENRRAEHHLVSMWLRHQKSLPLPLSADEKAEAKAESQEHPVQLDDDLLARREAVRQWAMAQGYSQEEADERFVTTMNQLVDE